MTDVRLATIGAGWITGIHLEALDRLGRTRLVGIASARAESARGLAEPRGATAYTDVERMLDEQRPDVAYVAVPPDRSVAIVERLVERGIPFLVEKPLAATDVDGPARVAAAISSANLVVAVGYHVRALPALDEVRAVLDGRAIHLVTAHWLCETPGPTWWRHEATGGGQVVEQATHFYDLARHLVGEARVVAAASIQDEPAAPAGTDVVDATAAVLQFENGAVGSFANTRRLASWRVEFQVAAADVLITIRRSGDDPRGWAVDIADGAGTRTISPGRDPYEVQAERFLDAVEAHDPTRVFSTYPDALETDRLTRAVVAATGRGG